MVFLHRNGARFDQPICHAAPWCEQRIGHIYGDAPEVVKGRNISGTNSDTWRRPTMGAILDGRSVYHGRHLAYDMSDLGDRLWCRHLRECDALSRANDLTAGLREKPGRECGPHLGRAVAGRVAVKCFSAPVQVQIITPDKIEKR